MLHDSNAELGQYLCLAQSQKGRGCVAVILQVLSSKKVFIFGELLRVPSIAALAGTEFNNAWETLNLFAFGSFKDYHANRSAYLDISAIHQYKLRQLSIISLAQEHKILNYDELMSMLELTDIRSLEAMLIQLIYSGMIVGKLDQLRRELKVVDVTARDVRPDGIQSLIQTLTTWRSICNGASESMKASSREISSSRHINSQTHQHIHTVIQSLRAAAKESALSGSSRDAGDVGDRDDREDEDVIGSSRSLMNQPPIGRSFKRNRGVGVFMLSGSDDARNS